MRTTITIRTDQSLRNALEERARAQGSTVSDVARTILRDALDARPLGTRTGHLRGGLSLRADPAGSLRRSLRERNWRP